jgi:hypothetical protein
MVKYTTSMVQWLEHWQANLMLRVQVTLDFSKRFSLPGISLLFIDPCIQVQKTEGGEYNLLVEVSVNSKEENS